LADENSAKEGFSVPNLAERSVGVRQVGQKVGLHVKEVQ
jgi:hypothetical protein